mgnify:CR=1 FL=1
MEISLLAGPALFELEEVGFRVPGRDLLHPLSLSLSGRRIHGLIGPNGSGKSTLIKMLAGQQAASTGVVRFGGKPVGDWGGRAFARKVAYLPQFTPAADGMTVRELVALGRFPWHGTLGRATAADRAESAGSSSALTGMARPSARKTGRAIRHMAVRDWLIAARGFRRSSPPASAGP